MSRKRVSTHNSEMFRTDTYQSIKDQLEVEN